MLNPYIRGLIVLSLPESLGVGAVKERLVSSGTTHDGSWGGARTRRASRREGRNWGRRDSFVRYGAVGRGRCMFSLEA